jgi:manganese/iron transport system ATP-binding protein
MSPLFYTHPTHPKGAPALILDHVSVQYDGIPALEDISLRIGRGEQVAVVGPNGAGKSTLFNVIAGIVRTRRGTVKVYGSGPGRHICVGYVPQRNRIDWRFPVTVADTVMMGRIGRIGLFRWPRKQDRERVAQALEQVGMSDFAHRQIGELSGGQQQRVFLARALAQEAELLLLDEPLSGLDMPSQEAILQILADLRRAGITMLVATHDLNQAAEQFPLLLLLNRRVAAFGAPDAVLKPEILSAAYGSQVHIIHGQNGEMLITDTCCSGGHVPVDVALGSMSLGPLAGASVQDKTLSPAAEASAEHLSTAKNKELIG